VWAPEEQRTESMARRLGSTVHHIHYLEYKRPLYAPFKYPLQWLKTWQVLWSKRPRYVYVTNPPVFAGIAAWIYCQFSQSRLILDTHPPALYMKKWAWSVPLQRWLAKRAYINITDQPRFKRLFDEWGSNHTVVLERPPKDVGGKHLTRQPDPNKFEIGVVNTFAEDEPLQCVLDAAKRLPDVKFYITGDTSKGDQAQIASAPANCEFTGYLRGDHYWNMLNGCRAVMALTEWKNSLIMAGQDGITLHKPVLMSKQETTVEYFYKGTVFVDNTGPSIAEGIREIQRREQELIAQTHEFLEEREKAWEANFKELERLIST
jgi:glycosyltransferase involved in cell wall biosynthesis